MPLPEMLQIEPTVLCNFKCRHCPNSELFSQVPGPSRHLDLELFKKIVDEVPTLREIKLQGLGEPLLCPDLRAMMEYGHGKGIAFNIISNGTLVAAKLPEILPFLKRFVISFDTFDQEQAEQRKRGFQVERCMADVHRMVQLKRQQAARCTVGITTVVSHENAGEIPRIMQFAQEAGVDYAGFVAVENWKTTGEAGYAESVSYVAAAARQVAMEKIKEQHARGGHTFQLGWQDFSPRKSNCYWMFNSAYVTYAGDVTPCCVRPNSRVFSFGNVKHAGFAEIWNGESARRFRATHLRRLPNPLCDRCPL